MSKLPVLKGTLDLLVLRALSWTPMHGFEIVSVARARRQRLARPRRLGALSGRLSPRGKGLLQADWGVTENNRRARYYKLTAAGARTSAPKRELGAVRRDRHRHPHGREGRERRWQPRNAVSGTP